MANSVADLQRVTVRSGKSLEQAFIALFVRGEEGFDFSAKCRFRAGLIEVGRSASVPVSFVPFHLALKQGQAVPNSLHVSPAPIRVKIFRVISKALLEALVARILPQKRGRACKVPETAKPETCLSHWTVCSDCRRNRALGPFSAF